MSEKSRMKEIAEEIVQHYKDNPSHGVGCTHMDNFSRELRSEFQVTPYWLHEESPEVEKGGRALTAILFRISADMYHYQKSKCTCPEDLYGVLPPASDCVLHGSEDARQGG